MADGDGDHVVGGQASLTNSGSLYREDSCYWGMHHRKACRPMGTKVCADRQEDVKVGVGSMILLALLSGMSTGFRFSFSTGGWE